MIISLVPVSPWLGAFACPDCEALHYRYDGGDLAWFVLSAGLGVVLLILCSSAGCRTSVWLAAAMSSLAMNAVPLLFLCGHQDANAIGFLNVVVGFVPLICLSARSPRMAVMVALGVVCLFTAILANAMLLDALTSQASQRSWSSWKDPRPGQVHDQYPLTNQEVMIVAVGLMTLSCLFGAALIALTRHRWSRVPSA